MRKLFLFLLLLAAGLFLLYWLDQRSRGVGPTPEPEPVPAPDEETQGFQPGGQSQLTIYDPETRLPAYKLEARDSRTERGVDTMTDVTLEIYDPSEEGLLLLRLRAVRARTKRLDTGGGLQPAIEPRLELETVRAEMEANSPLAPLTFETASAVVDLTDTSARRVYGSAPFKANGPQLKLVGEGFDLELDAERLEIPRSGRLGLLRDGVPAATLSATGTGPLLAHREEDQEGSVVLDVSGGAELEPGAKNPGRLKAEHLALHARMEEGVQRSFVIERLDADGDVDWTSGEARFQGQRLDARFLADGRVEHARLDGDPRAELSLILSAGVLPETSPDEQRLVVLEDQDAIDVDWRNGRYELHVESRPDSGPEPRVPSVVTRDFRLQSASTIDGWLSEDQRSAHFSAGGGVLVTSGSGTLETATFDVDIGPDEAGETVLTGRASGGARLVGEIQGETPEAPPRTFALTSPDSLTIERSSSGWRVIDGTQVDITVDEPRGFHARADRVSDFVVPRSASGGVASEGMRFQAGGNVQVEVPEGRFGGDELELVSVSPVVHFFLRGSRDSKAFLANSFGEAHALEVEVTGETLTARGEVSGSVAFSPEGSADRVLVTFSGDELTMDRNESPELLPGERLRILRGRVEGNVTTTVTSKDQTLVVQSQRFSAENRARLVEGADAPIELGSLFIAEGSVHGDYVAKTSDLTIDCERIEIERTANDVESGFRQITASGGVRFQGRLGEKKELDCVGDCELLVFDSARTGHMEATANGRVALFGRATRRRMPFRLTSRRIDFELADLGDVRLLALRPELRTLGLRAHAEHLTIDEESGAVLSGSVRISGATSANVPYTLAADEVTLIARRPRADAEREEGESSESVEQQLDALKAVGHIDFHLGESMRARGERLVVRRLTGLLRMEGSPASFEFGPTRLETEWIEFDPVLQILVSTGSGRLGSIEDGAEDGDEGSWSLQFLSLSTLTDPDSIVLVVQEPLFRTRQFESMMRASWAILWLNRQGVQDSDKRNQLVDSLRAFAAEFRESQAGSGPLEKLAFLRSTDLAGLLREVYLEGPVELLNEGELVARSDAVYLDVTSQHGWLAGATVHMAGEFLGQRRENLIVKADWLRVSGDASMRADSATVTSCEFEEPHIKVVTGDLKIKPSSNGGKEHYQLVLKDNRIELYDTFAIPLPTVDIATDEELKPLWPTLSLADSARFGTLFSFAITRPADSVGRVFDSLARPEDEAPGEAHPGEAEAPKPKKKRSDVDAHYKIDGSYLGSRGGLLDLGLEIEAKEDYWFDLYVALVPDKGDDRGYVRVDRDDRDYLRRWIRSQAYFDHGKSAWSFSFTDQSDPAVQSEFFEGKFVRYERKENYLQWRRSSNENFAQVSAKVHVEDFRPEVEELPSVSGYRGRSPLLHLGGLSLLHTGDVRAEYLRRRSGEGPFSPFDLEPDFGDSGLGAFDNLDGLGNRDVLRFDTTQSVELPVPLGSGLSFIPFVSARFTAWNEGVEQSDSPHRLLAEGGARIGTTFWKRGAEGALHQIAPYVEYRAELERKDEDGTPVSIDQVERVLSGDFTRIGTRARFGADATRTLLDLDLVATHARNRSDEQPDGWLPIEVLGRLSLTPFDHPVEVFHEGRYDIEDHRTEYSLLSVGTRVDEQWGLLLSHQRGRGEDERPLFETASIAGLYRWTEKWEFEARESFSLLENKGLDTKLLLRRYGHDIVFDLESSFREGEGSSIGFSIKPRFGYRPPRVGLVPW